MRISLRISQVGPKYHHTYPYKREGKEDYTNTHRRRGSNVTVEAEIDVATSQGLLAATKSWKRQTDSSLEHLEGIQPCQHIDFSPVKLMLNLWPPEL
uniref:Uncharacterized protein n=2 Tax=Macaca TaxID=9539 RepID=A0A5F7ZD11_MACMU|nr:unnamed protein product [Macaca fascicularis]